MKKFTISAATRKKAEKRAADLPLLNNSIRKGEGALVAYIGEALNKNVTDMHLLAS